MPARARNSYAASPTFRPTPQTVGHLYADLARETGGSNGEPAGDILARRVTEWMKSAGLPTRLRDCGVSRGILHLLAEEANAQWTARFNPRQVGEADLERLYDAAL